MASRYRVEELERQTAALAGDLPGLLRDATAAVGDALPGLPELDRIIALGSGDSLHAALACAPAFARTVDYRPMTASEFTRHPPAPETPRARTAIVGISASGGNPSIVATVTDARGRGHPTVAVTSTADSPLSAAARTTLRVRSGAMEPSPGIRTYQASLVTLLCLAGRLAAAGGAPESGAERPAGLADPWRLADAVRRSAALARPALPPLVDAWASAPVVMVAGSGPGLGTARHVAAKITEAAAQPAVGVELEDWWHVHRFGHERGNPVLFVATPGPARDAVVAMARRTAQRRPVAVVAAEGDEDAAGAGDWFVPVAPGVSDVCRPLIDHVFAGPLAAGLAQRRGVLPFANP